LGHAFSENISDPASRDLESLGPFRLDAASIANSQQGDLATGLLPVDVVRRIQATAQGYLVGFGSYAGQDRPAQPYSAILRLMDYRSEALINLAGFENGVQSCPFETNRLAGRFSS
jgi:hypothetical protein